LFRTTPPFAPGPLSPHFLGDGFKVGGEYPPSARRGRVFHQAFQKNKNPTQNRGFSQQNPLSRPDRGLLLDKKKQTLLGKTKKNNCDPAFRRVFPRLYLMIKKRPFFGPGQIFFQALLLAAVFLPFGGKRARGGDPGWGFRCSWGGGDRPFGCPKPPIGKGAIVTTNPGGGMIPFFFPGADNPKPDRCQHSTVKGPFICFTDFGEKQKKRSRHFPFSTGAGGGGGFQVGGPVFIVDFWVKKQKSRDG